MAERMGQTFVPPYEAIGVTIDGRLAGGVIFNCYTGTNVEVTIAGEWRAWSRSVVRELGKYAFDQLGVSRVTITSDVPEVIMFAVRLGARPEGKLRDWYGPGRDAAIMGVLKRDWTFR